MPHLIFECSQELEQQLPFQQIFADCHQMLSDLLPTQITSCKSRIIPYSKYLVGDESKNMFIHLTIRILPGRSQEVKSDAAGKAITIVRQNLRTLDIINTSISVDLYELSPHYMKETI